MATKKKGFTLIELLIVVAIIAILAAIAVPNFLEAQMRSKIARVRTDMRTVAVGMEAYFVDWNGYPQHRDFAAPPPPPEQQRPWWQGLTTPVAYLTMVPKDPFFYSTTALSATPWGGGYIHYDPVFNTWDGIMGNSWGPWDGFVPEMRNRGIWWVLWSVGPDGLHDFAGWASPNSSGGMTNKGTAMAVFYDPTNGTVSRGDLIRFGPGASDAITF
jgi:prepilin-type N-terminal cleavage/methylation domain-containing protein